MHKKVLDKVCVKILEELNENIKSLNNGFLLEEETNEKISSTEKKLSILQKIWRKTKHLPVLGVILRLKQFLRYIRIKMAISAAKRRKDFEEKYANRFKQQMEKAKKKSELELKIYSLKVNLQNAIDNKMETSVINKLKSLIKKYQLELSAI